MKMEGWAFGKGIVGVILHVDVHSDGKDLRRENLGQK